VRAGAKPIRRSEAVLVELRLNDLAVAADVRLELGDGLNALTGSTGAGKSLVVTGLRWIAGEDVDRNALREGADRASAEAVFDLQGRDDLLEALRDVGVDVPSDGFLLLRREVRRGGRARAFVNGRASSAAVLRAACDRLAEMQSQHEQLLLRRASEHVHVLDGLGVDPGVREAWHRAFEEWRAVRREVERWRARQEQLRERRELLEYQLRELTDAGLTGDETEELRVRVARNEGGAQLIENAAAALDAIESEDAGAQRALSEATARLRNVPDELTDLVEVREQLEAAIDLAADAQRALERFVDARDFDPAALARDQARLAELQTLSRKYGMTEAELVALRDRLEDELGGLSASGEPPEDLRRRREATREALGEAGAALDRARRRVARRVEREAPDLLAELGMPGAAIHFELVPHEDPAGEVRVGGRRIEPAADGPSRVELVVRTNPGERPGPIETVASGGELSRIGLVLRSLAAGRRRAALLVLDEVDAGLGADLGPALARRLRALAQHGQVLVISHLPAVAAAADTHLVAAKSSDGERTASRVDTVGGDERVRELQRMLGGETDRSLAMARQLLQHRGDLPVVREESSSA
jgi:DNA repair protein RecN (Recombination protein N)